jgi:hypothetical protein
MKFCLVVLSILVASVNSIAQEKFYTCINENGERVFSIKATHAYSFSDGLAEIAQSVLEGTKSYTRWGFIDKTGKTVIQCQYEKVYSFSSGVAWVKKPGDEKYVLINKKGEQVNSTGWKKVGYFIEGFCAVYDEEDKMGFVNRKGELVIPCQYTGDSFSEGLACVMPYEGVKANYGFIDTTGKVVIPFQFNQAGTSSFKNGECRVQINGVTCLINSKGEVIFKPALTKNCMGFSNGLSASYTKYETRSGWGYYNRNNEWVITPQYDGADDFQGGLAVVEKDGKFGVIDTTGKIIIPIQYASIFGHPAEDGWFGLETESNGEKTYVNGEGKPFAQVPVKYIAGGGDTKNIMPYTSPDNRCGYLNGKGEVVVEAQFDRTFAFSEGLSWIWGNASNLPIAKGSTAENFAKDFKIGDSASCQKNKTGPYLPVTIDQTTEFYYLITFADGTQTWVVYNQLK